MKKTFDCVEMMHRGGAAVYEKIKDMTFEEEVAYWAERDRVFRAEIEARRREHAKDQERAAPAA